MGARTLAQVFDLQTANHGTGNTTGFGPDAQPERHGERSRGRHGDDSRGPSDRRSPLVLEGVRLADAGGKDGKKSPFEQFSDCHARRLSGPKELKAAMDAQEPERSALTSSGPGARNVSPGLQNAWRRPTDRL